jgi:hypothetical protein
MKMLLLSLLVTLASADYVITYKGTKYIVTDYKKYGDCVVINYKGTPKSFCSNYKIKELP